VLRDGFPGDHSRLNFAAGIQPVDPGAWKLRLIHSIDEQRVMGLETQTYIPPEEVFSGTVSDEFTVPHGGSVVVQIPLRAPTRHFLANRLGYMRLIIEASCSLRIAPYAKANDKDLTTASWSLEQSDFPTPTPLLGRAVDGLVYAAAENLAEGTSHLAHFVRSSLPVPHSRVAVDGAWGMPLLQRLVVDSCIAPASFDQLPEGPATVLLLKNVVVRCESRAVLDSLLAMTTDMKRERVRGWINSLAKVGEVIEEVTARTGVSVTRVRPRNIEDETENPSAEWRYYTPALRESLVEEVLRGLDVVRRARRDPSVRLARLDGHEWSRRTKDVALPAGQPRLVRVRQFHICP
jgi:hypothetical protein